MASTCTVLVIVPITSPLISIETLFWSGSVGIENILWRTWLWWHHKVEHTDSAMWKHSSYKISVFFQPFKADKGVWVFFDDFVFFISWLNLSRFTYLNRSSGLNDWPGSAFAWVLFCPFLLSRAASQSLIRALNRADTVGCLILFCI